MGDALPQKVEVLCQVMGDRPDSAYVVFASPETRCLGTARLIEGYHANTVCLLRITDEPNRQREKNIAELNALCAPVGPIVEIEMEHSDPVIGVRKLASVIQESYCPPAPVSVDVSTFPRNSLLLVLRALSMLDPAPPLRILYTEPGRYSTDKLGRGLKEVTPVPTYSAPYDPDKEVALIIFLGFERDRALGLWENIEPHESIAIIADPPFHEEWQGDAERINAALLARIDEDMVYRVAPRDPEATCRLLEELIAQRPPSEQPNFYVAPIGTKPQTVGVAYYCLRHPYTCTVIYASPLERPREYFSEEVGPTWVLGSGVTLG